MEEILIKLITLDDYADLVEEYGEPKARTRWGVLCTPFLRGGYWCIPLGWEDELKKMNISFTIREIKIEIKEDE